MPSQLLIDEFFQSLYFKVFSVSTQVDIKKMLTDMALAKNGIAKCSSISPFPHSCNPRHSLASSVLNTLPTAQTLGKATPTELFVVLFILRIQQEGARLSRAVALEDVVE